MNTEYHVWTVGCYEWVRQGLLNGSKPYYLNFMFEPLRGTTQGIIAQMHRAIHKDFYSKFCTRFVRNTHRLRERKGMPELWLFPDRPVWKREKTSHTEVSFNSGGLHFNGPMLIPPFSRFRECPIEFINLNQWRYTSGNIARIHVEEIDSRMFGIVDYSVKSIKWHRADPDDVLVLPKTIHEVARTSVSLTPEQRALKDIQSALNVDDEVARDIYEARRCGL